MMVVCIVLLCLACVCVSLHTSLQAETTKAQAEERPVGETTVVEKPSPLFKDPRKPGLRPAGLSTHCDYTQQTLHSVSKNVCNIRCVHVFPIQIQVLLKFPKGLVRTNGCGKTCSRLRHPHRHPQRHQRASPHLTAASRPGWNWPRESQWPGATSPWTEWRECTCVVVQCMHPRPPPNKLTD